jgi:alginate O-acetyltransferase complex protein AlgI
MVFTSFIYYLFFPTVFGLYWFVFQRHLKAQNVLLLVASYFFYGWWDWRFLSLVAFSTVLDYTMGRLIGAQENEGKRLWLLRISLGLNLVLLGFFKYYNFFVTSWVDAWASVGIHMPDATLHIILPLGISFYTFQSMSYSLDVYKGRLEPIKDFLSFATFVSFFPQLVAGPIERAVHFLPQVTKPRSFDYQRGVDGIRLMLWGMFKKVVIADNLAVLVDDIYRNHETMGSVTLALGALYFTVQVYCDFSGYSDIAIGSAKLLGFELMSNFRFPLLARSIPEFWSRWHISLTTWLNDYLFTPVSLALRNLRKNGIALAIVITFLVSGIWHGAKWTFVVWGLINGLLFIPYVMRGRLMQRAEVVAKGKWLPSLRELLQILLVFSLWTLTLVFFRADSLAVALGYFKNMATHLEGPVLYKTGLVYVVVLMVLDWFNREDERNPRVLQVGPRAFRLAVESIMAIVIFFNMLSGYKEFVYFDF